MTNSPLYFTPKHAYSGEDQRLTLVKQVTKNNKIVQLLFDRMEGLVVGKVADNPIPGYAISGIPSEIKKDVKILKEYLKRSFLVVNRGSLNGAESFFIYVHTPLKGGGNGNVKQAKKAYASAESLDNKKLHQPAIKAYRETIAAIKQAEQDELSTTDRTVLNERLRDSYFSMGINQQKIGEPEGALQSFQEADKLGKEGAGQKILIVLIQLANQAEIDGDLSSQMGYLLEAKKLGSPEAEKKLTELVNAKEKKRENFRKDPVQTVSRSELLKRTVRARWEPSFELGKGITLKGQPCLLSVKNIQCKSLTADMSSEKCFEYCIYNEDDLKNLEQVEGGVCLEQNSWYLQAIKEYAKDHIKPNGKTIYCLVAKAYISPDLQIFEKGELAENCSQYWQREGFQKFTEMFGTHFIGGVSKGALFLGSIALKVTGPEDALILRTILNGSMSLLDTLSSEDIEYKKIEEKWGSGSIKTIGLSEPSGGAPKNISDFQQKYREFSDGVKNSKTLASVEAICEPWQCLEEAITKIILKPIEKVVSLSHLLAYRRERVVQSETTRALRQLYTPLKAVSHLTQLNAEGNGPELYDTFQAFLQGNKKVLVLLGQAGGGKSTFLEYIEYELWQQFDPMVEFESFIPIRIELGSLMQPVTRAVHEHLTRLDFTESQIQELKEKGKLLIILDGYDEGRHEQNPLTQNLYRSNRLEEWNGKVIISGRLFASDLLNPNMGDHLSHFGPKEAQGTRVEEFVEEWLICPFSPKQVETYIKKFVAGSIDAELKKEYPDWFKDEGAKFNQVIKQNPSLEELVKIPFILHIIAEILPKLWDENSKKITKTDIYRHYTARCFEREFGKEVHQNQKRPKAIEMENIVKLGTEFCRQFANRLENDSYVIYIEEKEEMKEINWFLGSEEVPAFLRNICSDVIRRTRVFHEGRERDQYAFVHLELRDYFLSLLD